MIAPDLIQRFHDDPESVHSSWFLDEGRMKAFRTIRRGIQVLVEDLEAGRLFHDYRGSTLETVVEAVAEQKQVFAGAAHPFYWKPKLRIPDIYESPANQRRFGALLRAALRATDPRPVLTEILNLAATPVKGLGPASGNLLYFLHPTVFPPFNTAILNGYNLLTAQNLKLGSWPAYLQMRDGMSAMIAESGGRLSRDLGDISGLCFEIGSQRMAAAELPGAAMDQLRERWEKETTKRHREIVADVHEQREHAEQQARLAALGQSWGYDVWIARNDHGRAWRGGRLGEFSLPDLPVGAMPTEVQDTVQLIDVLWLHRQRREVVGAFEVEKSTSIYSGILRLFDLALTVPACRDHLYLVAPDSRERGDSATYPAGVDRHRGAAAGVHSLWRPDLPLRRHVSFWHRRRDAEEGFAASGVRPTPARR